MPRWWFSIGVVEVAMLHNTNFDQDGQHLVTKESIGHGVSKTKFCRQQNILFSYVFIVDIGVVGLVYGRSIASMAMKLHHW
jgi:hypothetical protein